MENFNINDILAQAQAMQAGQFPSKPEARSCPRCPHFFLCGELPGGRWVQEKL